MNTSDIDLPRILVRPPTKLPSPFNTHPNNRTSAPNEHKRKQNRTFGIPSINNANMLKKWSTKLLGGEVKETTVDQIRNAPSALWAPEEAPSEHKRAIQQEQYGAFILTIIRQRSPNGFEEESLARARMARCTPR